MRLSLVRVNNVCCWREEQKNNGQHLYCCCFGLFTEHSSSVLFFYSLLISFEARVSLLGCFSKVVPSLAFFYTGGINHMFKIFWANMNGPMFAMIVIETRRSVDSTSHALTPTGHIIPLCV